MSDPTTSDTIGALTRAIERLHTELRNAEDLIRAVQAELLAGGSLVRLRAIVGINPKEQPHNAERS